MIQGSIMGNNIKSNSIFVLSGQVLSMILRFASNLILAWLLVPESFGIIALIIPFLIGLQLFSDVGVSACIIRSNNGDLASFYNTARTINMLRGLALYFFAYLIAPILGEFYSLPKFSDLFSLAALTLAIKGAESIAIQLAIRNQKVGKIVILDLATQVFTSVITIALAMQEASSRSIVMGMVCGAVFRAIFSYVLFRGYEFNFCWDKQAYKEIFNLGRWIFFSTVFTFLAMQSDRLILGTYIEAEALGVYYIAATLAVMPSDIISRFSANILYPLYSKEFRKNVSELSIILQQKRKIILMLMFILVAGLISISGLFFSHLYKQSYHGAIELMPYFLLLTWFSMLQVTLDRAILAFGNAKYLAKINFVSFISKIFFSLCGYTIYHEKGFIIGLVLGAIISYTLTLRWVCVKINIKYIDDVKYTFAILILLFVAIVLPKNVISYSILFPFLCGGYVAGAIKYISPSLFRAAISYISVKLIKYKSSQNVIR
jgi:O-antigen/teichoic acid export membrane protein